MAKSRKKAEVAYKDTFEFKCFPEYKYTAQQKSRFVLFQGRVEHWRAAINYADNFNAPDKINLLYMLGYDKGMHDAVMKCESNLVILCAKIPKELLKAHDEYWELIDGPNFNGYFDENGNRSEWFQHEVDANRAAVNLDDEYVARVARDTCAEYDRQDAIIEAYRQAVPKINKCYERYTIIDKLHPEKTIDHKDLDKIIKRYYPFGREQCKVWDGAYKGGKVIDSAIECGLQDGDGVKFLRMPPDDKDAAEILRKNVKRLEMNINTAVRERGHVNLGKLYEEMRAPPWGWSYGKDACAAFCLGKCMSKFIDGWYISDATCVFNVSECVPGLLTLVAIDQLRAPVILSNEDGWHIADRLAYIIGIDSERPFSTTLMKARLAIEQHTRYPVDFIDHKLYELLNLEHVSTFEERNDPVVAVTDMHLDTPTLREFQKYFTWDKCEELHQKYLTINEDTEAYLGGIFPGLSFEKIKRQCTTQCSGWLRDKWGFQLTCYTEYMKLSVDYRYGCNDYDSLELLYGSTYRYYEVLREELDNLFGGHDSRLDIKESSRFNGHVNDWARIRRMRRYESMEEIHVDKPRVFCPYCKHRNILGHVRGMVVKRRRASKPGEMAEFGMTEPDYVYSYNCSWCNYAATESSSVDEAYDIAVRESAVELLDIRRDKVREKLKQGSHTKLLIPV